MDIVPREGQMAPVGAVQLTVERHKNNFMSQYGTFEDKSSQNVTRWLAKALKYKNSHMIPSLEMASIVIHCIRGEPAIKIKRMLDVPGVNYVHSDHYSAQPLQVAVAYTPYFNRVEQVIHVPGVLPQDAVVADAEADPPILAADEVLEVIEVPAVALEEARPAIHPVRHQPLVLWNQCLSYYLTQTYQKQVNLSDASKFLNTFKTQKPKQTCSNFLDEFVINYENYAHLKWTTIQMDGVEAIEGVEADPQAIPPVLFVEAVIAIEGNQVQRNSDMLHLAIDGICDEFKVYCDNTQIQLLTIDFPTLETSVQNWQRNTTTGKAFTAKCTPANNQTKNANVSALEMSNHFDVEKSLHLDDVQSSSTQLSGRGQRGGRGARGVGRGQRGGRGARGAGRGQPRNAIQSKDTQDGGFHNYRQTQDNVLITSPQGHPLCNYCGRPSHKRELCGVKRNDRAAGLTRTFHPDRDTQRPKPGATTAEATGAPLQQHPPAVQYPAYSFPSWTQPPMVQPFQGAGTPWQQQQQQQQQPQGQNVQSFVHAARMEHDQGAQNHNINPTTASAQTTNSNPCPFQNCQAILTDPYVAQEHIRMFHSQQTNLAMMPGSNL